MTAAMLLQRDAFEEQMCLRPQIPKCWRRREQAENLLTPQAWGPVDHLNKAASV